MKHSLPSAAIHSFGPLPAQPWWERRRGQLLALLLAALLLLGSRVQATAIITVGSGPADYLTIALALAAVPSPLTQPYELQLLSGSYAEDVLVTKTGTAVNTLTIRPGQGATAVVDGTFTFGAGSAYVTLSGNNGLSSSSRALTLRQTNPLAPALVFSGDASHNTASELLVRGATSSWTSGVVVVGDGRVSGNDHNALTQSYINNAGPSQLPANRVYAANASGGTNDAFALTGNQLSNFTRTGVLVAGGNGDGWTISNNSIRHYRFVDAGAGKAGVRYYRLRQDDRMPGEPRYYGPHKLEFEAPAASFAAYPTQFGPALTVALTHPGAATATLRLLDGLGREVWCQEVAPGAAPLHVQPVAPAGAYVLTATVAGQVLRQRVVKE